MHFIKSFYLYYNYLSNQNCVPTYYGQMRIFKIVITKILLQQQKKKKKREVNPLNSPWFCHYIYRYIIG